MAKTVKIEELPVGELNEYYKMACAVEEKLANDIKASQSTQATALTPDIVHWKNAVMLKRKILARYDDIIAEIVNAK